MRIDSLFVAALAISGQAALGAEGPPPPGPPPVDPDIREIVSDVSLERMQRSIFVLASFKTRHTLSDPSSNGDGIGAAASWIKAEFSRVAKASGDRLRVELDAFDQGPLPPGIPRQVRMTNIVATLPGSRPASAGRIYVACAHYDSRVTNPLDATSPAPGADDDASGAAAVLELARVISRFEFPATLVFLAEDGGEQGAVGAAHWAKEARAGGLDVAGVLDLDGIGNSRAAGGRIDRYSLRLFAQGVPASEHPDERLLALIRAGGENDSGSRALARTVSALAGVYVPRMHIRQVLRADRYSRHGDPLSFSEQGYPAILLTETTEDPRHERQDVRVAKGVKFGDLPEFVDFGYAADIARIGAAALAGVARAPATPRGVRIEAAMDGGAALSWEANAEPDLAGYRILWRETTTLSWEHSIDVGRGETRRTIPGISVDDAVFGVEAFDAAGHASPAAFPTAGADR